VQTLLFLLSHSERCPSHPHLNPNPIAMAPLKAVCVLTGPSDVTGVISFCQDSNGTKPNHPHVVLNPIGLCK
jgi:hypothetical protein